MVALGDPEVVQELVAGELLGRGSQWRRVSSCTSSSGSDGSVFMGQWRRRGGGGRICC
jgi:hypothetical protein